MKMVIRTIKIKHIDHDKIKEGQMIYKGRVFECLTDVGAIPYKTKIMKKLELKILPNNFEKAMNSSDRSVSQAYQNWQKKDFPDWWTMGELETKWRTYQPRLSEVEWLKIFPEAKPYLKKRLKEIEEKAYKLNKEIYSDFLRIEKKYNDFELWFFKKIIKIWKGERLDEMIKEIKKIKFALSQPKKTKGGVSKQQIEMARQRDIEDFIEPRPKKHFSICPFHSEQKPSFYTKRGWGFCFGCGWKGDVIKFLMERDGLTFIEAVKRLST